MQSIVLNSAVIGPPRRHHLALNRADNPRETPRQRVGVNDPPPDNGPVGDLHLMTVHDSYAHRVVVHHHAASPVGQMDTSTGHIANKSAATNAYPSS